MKQRCYAYDCTSDAGWSSSVARWAHNPEVVGSNPAPATNVSKYEKGADFSAFSHFRDPLLQAIAYFKRRELLTTKRLLIAIAAAAYTGVAKPKAAIGIPMTL